ncbi:four-carbon acid sugar kinase family protein [Arthrobacter crusticola]|uniref:four-carbon acid sugar kinase family protein n=1 Tax=Arthrobacter crusticola TaxID=2547960 RepID=UPI0026845857
MLIDSALAPFPAPVEVAPGDLAASLPRSVFVVLDDDPTGTQSVADLPVLTSWEEADITWALEQSPPAFYVLTNTRSLSEADAEARNRTIAENSLRAAARLGRELVFVSRGDSTLRGHFPLETDVLARAIVAETGTAIDGVIIAPAFPDAGRVTIGSVHYMRDGGNLVPVAETEFARDATFGYRSSDLRDYVSEKTRGRWQAQDVLPLNLATLRAGAAAIADALDTATSSAPVVADAVTEDDLRLLALGCREAQRRGKHFLFRVGPPFVRAAIGQLPHPPLTRPEIYAGPGENNRGGLIIVGSHVGVTGRQLEHLKGRFPSVHTGVIDVGLVVGEETREAHLSPLVQAAAAALEEGNVIIHTSRQLVSAATGEESLAISRRVSAAVVDVVGRILAATPPRFVVAKGGITSSDVAVHALKIRRAMVRGPMLPGIVSLWEPTDGPAQGIPYVVFAGNVGSDTSLSEVVATLTAESPTLTTAKETQ